MKTFKLFNVLFLAAFFVSSPVAGSNGEKKKTDYTKTLKRNMLKDVSSFHAAYTKEEHKGKDIGMIEAYTANHLAFRSAPALPVKLPSPEKGIERRQSIAVFPNTLLAQRNPEHGEMLFRNSPKPLPKKIKKREKREKRKNGINLKKKFVKKVTREGRCFSVPDTLSAHTGVVTSAYYLQNGGRGAKKPQSEGDKRCEGEGIEKKESTLMSQPVSLLPDEAPDTLKDIFQPGGAVAEIYKGRVFEKRMPKFDSASSDEEPMSPVLDRRKLERQLSQRLQELVDEGRKKETPSSEEDTGEVAELEEDLLLVNASGECKKFPDINYFERFGNKKRYTLSLEELKKLETKVPLPCSARGPQKDKEPLREEISRKKAWPPKQTKIEEVGVVSCRRFFLAKPSSR